MKFIEKFCDILQEQLKLHEQLVSLSTEKKAILIEGSLERLERLIKSEHRLIQEVQYLERDRSAMVKQLAEALKISPDRVTISFLTDVVQLPEEKQRLGELKGDLQQVIEELMQINEVNSNLLKQSLEYIQATMEAITDDPGEDIVYTNPAKLAGRKGKSVFDAKS